MTKILFLAFWYSSIFPGALFLCSIALCVNYYTDKFSLMRSWKRSPHISSEISNYSRHYFFSTACIFLAIMSSFYWAAFPFDNLCADKTRTLDPSYYGTHQLNTTAFRAVAAEYQNVTLTANTTIYKYCRQNFLHHESGFYFPFIYRNQPNGGEWMTPDQIRLSYIFGWTSVAVIGLILSKFIISTLKWLRTLFVSEYQVCN